MTNHKCENIYIGLYNEFHGFVVCGTNADFYINDTDHIGSHECDMQFDNNNTQDRYWKISRKKDKGGNTQEIFFFFFLIYSLGIDERLIANFLEKLKMCGPPFELCFVGLCRTWKSQEGILASHEISLLTCETHVESIHMVEFIKLTHKTIFHKHILLRLSMDLAHLTRKIFGGCDGCSSRAWLKYSSLFRILG